MATLFEDVYISFLAKVDDYDFVNYDNDTKESILYNLLESSVSDLITVTTINIPTMDKQSKTFNGDIDNVLKEIIAYGMVANWLEPKLYNSMWLKDFMGTKDYSIHSPGNLISKKSELLEKTKARQKSMIRNYSWRNATV